MCGKLQGSLMYNIFDGIIWTYTEGVAEIMKNLDPLITACPRTYRSFLLQSLVTYSCLFEKYFEWGTTFNNIFSAIHKGSKKETQL
jgi:hypothetical protein